MPDAVGAELELEVGGVAQGGACVARHEGRVVFVRHALPGERVRAVITEARDAYWRADAVVVLRAAPGRITPPCPHAGALACGGCDWQHATATVQRELKAEVVREQFRRVAHLEVPAGFAVEALPSPGSDRSGLLGWRTRTQYARSADGRFGLHRHRSDVVEVLGSCPLGVPGVDRPPPPDDPDVAGAVTAEVVAAELPSGSRAPADVPVTVVAHGPARASQGAARGRRRAHRAPGRAWVARGPGHVMRHVLGRDLLVPATAFWQVHPAAAPTFARAVVDAVAPRAGERVLDLYAGAGLLTLALADAVADATDATYATAGGGAGTRVVGVDAAPGTVEDARDPGVPLVRIERERVRPELVARLVDELGGVDVIVVDPPRAGVDRAVLQAVLDAAPRVIGYLSCDPATLARDVAVAVQAGWQLASLRAFDAFPMTHHVECLATLRPPVGPRA